MEHYRKMLLSMAEDARVILVKQKRRERERQVVEMQRPPEEALEAAGVPAEVVGRAVVPTSCGS